MSKKSVFLPKIGLDIVDISRFKRFKTKAGDCFLNKVFSAKEMTYCFGFKKPAIHLAGIFAAKEAVSKALGTKNFPSVDLEIRHDENNAPVVFKKGQRLAVNISISHERTVAAAVAIA